MGFINLKLIAKNLARGTRRIFCRIALIKRPSEIYYFGSHKLHHLINLGTWVKKLNQYIRPLDICFILLLVCVYVQASVTPYFLCPGGSASYLYAAHDLSLGHINLSDNFYANRIGTTAIYALAMKFLGWEGLQLCNVGTMIFLLLLIVIYKVVSKYNSDIAFYAVALLGFSSVIIAHLHPIDSDITTMLLANAPVLVYFIFWKDWQRGIRRSARLFGLLAGVLFVLAILAKESIIFFLPLFCWWAFCDRKDEKKVFWVTMFGVVAIGGLGICLWYKVMTGDFFYRLSAVTKNCSWSDSNYARAPFSLILKRITYHPILFFIEKFNFGVIGLFSLLNLCRRTTSREANFFKEYLLFTLGMWWIAPQGLPWNPVALAYRLWLPLLVPLAINAAIMIYDIIKGNLSWHERKVLSVMVFIFFIALPFCLWHSWVVFKITNSAFYPFQYAIGYSVVCIALVVSLLIKDDVIPRQLKYIKWSLFAIIIALFLGPYNAYASCIGALQLCKALPPPDEDHRTNFYNRDQQLVLRVEALDPNCILCEDELTNQYHIYDGFKKDYPFIGWSTIKPDSIPKGAFLMIDRAWINNQKIFPESNVYTLATDTGYFELLPDFVIKPFNYGFVLINKVDSCEVWKFKGYGI
jgi:hypothetical protein